MAETICVRLGIVAAALGAALSLAEAGFAQAVHPWCLKADVGAGAMVDYCHFATFEHCAQERFRWGTTSFCILNPAHYFRQRMPERPPLSARRRSER